MKILISLVFLIFAFSPCREVLGTNPNSSGSLIANRRLKILCAQKPIVIDFYAGWCPNCRELDQEVFSLPQIQAQLAQVTALRMDVTNQDDPKAQEIIQEYGVEGVPTVIFLDGKGQEIKDSRIIGLVTPKNFSSIGFIKITI